MKFIYFIRNAKAQKDSEIEDLQRDLKVQVEKKI
ncbi:Uncharacterised protein [Campylobacter insulaenigrae]|nr:Uncharacterised protein [Campylobacter insulaenigrae]